MRRTLTSMRFAEYLELTGKVLDSVSVRTLPKISNY
jgi:hypothetical protein